MPHGDVLLSAGCAGAWYFDWVEEFYGSVKHHIGLEYYSPRPAELPTYVSWIQNTVGDMHDIPDGSIDVIFSGQNVEHVWLRDMISFFLEAHRTLALGGFLVMDSPNRAQTEKLNWSHPEHTVELTVPEAKAAFALAGFEVVTCKGIWAVENTDGSTINLEPTTAAEAIVRASIGVVDPDRAFAWWIEAEKAAAPQPEQLAAHLQGVFERAWPERMQRSSVLGATRLPGSGKLVNELGYPSVVRFGPYAPLPSGEYAVTFGIEGLELATSTMGSADVMVNEVVVASSEISALQSGERRRLRLEFCLDDDMSFGVQFRVHSTGVARFATDALVEFEDLSEATLGPAYDRRPRQLSPTPSNGAH